MLDKEILRLMAEAERMMDEGKIPFVMAPGPKGIHERLAVSEAIMEDFGLTQGQNVNTILRDAILEANLKRLADKLVDAAQDLEDAFIDEVMEDEFDFRDYMNEGDDNATKH